MGQIYFGDREAKWVSFKSALTADGYRYLRALFVALPKAKTVDDYAALLPWRIDLGAA